jgi:hypothetical protein
MANKKNTRSESGVKKKGSGNERFLRIINDKRIMVPITVLLSVCVVCLAVLLALDASGVLYGFGGGEDKGDAPDGDSSLVSPELLDGVKHKSGNYEYRLLKDGTAELYFYENPSNRYETEIVVPSEIDGYPVSVIGSECFVWMASLVSVTVPDGVTDIGAEAFSGCGNLLQLRLPKSLVRIDEHAFKGCPHSMKVEYSGDISKVTVGEGNSSLTDSIKNGK